MALNRVGSRGIGAGKTNGKARLKPADRAKDLSKRSQRLSERSSAVAEKAKGATGERATKLSNRSTTLAERSKRLGSKAEKIKSNIEARKERKASLGKRTGLTSGKYRTAADGSPVRDSGNQINNRNPRPSSGRNGYRTAADGSPVTTRSKGVRNAGDKRGTGGIASRSTPSRNVSSRTESRNVFNKGR